MGAAAGLGVLVGRLPVLAVLEDIAVPLLISLATILEIVAFVFIYGKNKFCPRMSMKYTYYLLFNAMPLIIL